MKDHRVTVKVSPALGLALETRKLELKKKGVPVKSMENLIARLLLEATGEAVPASDVTELRGGYHCEKDHEPDHERLEKILTDGTSGPDGQIVGIRSNLSAFMDQIELRKLKDRPKRRAAGQ